jgi:hypothetical protein
MDEDLSNNSIQTPAPSATPDVTVEETRRKYLNREASVKSIGALYLLGAIITILVGISGAVSEKEATPGVRITVVILCTGLGLFQFWVGRGLQKLKSWARIPTGILSGIGLLLFPLGTLINACILYLVFSKKGSMVFSPQYQQVIAATPHIKYKTHIIVWILFGLLIVLIAIIFIIAVIAEIAY